MPAPDDTTRSTLVRQITIVYRFALRLAAGDRHLADDLTQDAMMRTLNAHPPRNEDECRMWLLRITSNLWRDHLRKQKVRRRGQEHLRRRPVAEDHPHVPQTLLRELDRLPERQREVLYLSACEGLTTAQVATVLDITAEAVKSSRSLARQRMRDALHLAEASHE